MKLLGLTSGFEIIRLNDEIEELAINYIKEGVMP